MISRREEARVISHSLIPDRIRLSTMSHGVVGVRRYTLFLRSRCACAYDDRFSARERTHRLLGMVRRSYNPAGVIHEELEHKGVT